MSSISIKIQGGLGNMFFEIACAYSYAKKNNKKLILKKEDSVVIHKHLDFYKENFLNNCQYIFSSEGLQNPKIYNELGFHFNEIPTTDGDVYLTGYFQSEKYFMDYEKDIKNLFSFPYQLSGEIIEKFSNKYGINILDNKSFCSIHIRRGDYLNSPDHHPTQSMNYYMRAIKQMPSDSIFLIFSDDIKWCKESFPYMPEKFIFIDGFLDYEDLFLMKSCKNNIICNSTFSWWGAWLNDNENKKVISPTYDKWFGKAYQNYDTKDIIPSNWIQI